MVPKTMGNNVGIEDSTSRALNLFIDKGGDAAAGKKKMEPVPSEHDTTQFVEEGKLQRNG